MKGTIKRGLQYGENSVGGGLAGAAGIVIVSGFTRCRLGCYPLAADALGLGGYLVAPTVETIGGQFFDLDRAELR